MAKDGCAQEARTARRCHTLCMEPPAVCDAAGMEREGGRYCGELTLHGSRTPTGASRHPRTLNVKLIFQKVMKAHFSREALRAYCT